MTNEDRELKMTSRAQKKKGILEKRIEASHQKMNALKLFNRWLRGRRNPLYGLLYLALIFFIAQQSGWGLIGYIATYILFVLPLILTSDHHMGTLRNFEDGLLLGLSLFTLGFAGLITQYATKDGSIPQQRSLSNPMTFFISLKNNGFNKQKLLGLLSVTAFVVVCFYVANTDTTSSDATVSSTSQKMASSSTGPETTSTPQNPTLSVTATTEPLFKPPAVAFEEAAFQCDTKLFDLLDNYNITNLDPQNIARTWFNNSDYKFRVGITPPEISTPIINACAEAAKKRISQVTYAAESSCSYVPRKELAKAYGVPSSSSKNKIAAAVARDFLPRFKSLVIAACLRKMD